MTDLTICPVRTPDDIAEATRLTWAFFDATRKRFPEMSADADAYIITNNVAGKLARFTDHYAPPNGECLLARLDGAAVGTLMLQPHSDGVCEMNRMFVDPKARGHGIGRKLCLALLQSARDLGYARMRLDTLRQMTEALTLYRSVGFAEVSEPLAFGADHPQAVQMRITL
jgi:GNAT superfamily N-acetyltransferase